MTVGKLSVGELIADQISPIESDTFELSSNLQFVACDSAAAAKPWFHC